jgi:diguanylate cyclase
MKCSRPPEPSARRDLTGAWNRNSMFQKLAEEQDRMVRNKQQCCLCMMDLDHFKQVNDTYGHAAGDKVLHFAVEHAGEYLRKYDSIFRYGGEEFLLCLPNISAEDAVVAMDRIRAGLEKLDITLPGGQTIIHVTASFGVAPVSVDRSVEENINVADQALFCAKVSGRNRVCLWGNNEAPQA